MNARLTTGVRLIAIALLMVVSTAGIGCRSRSNDGVEPTSVATEEPVVEPTSTSAPATPALDPTEAPEPTPTESTAVPSVPPQDAETLMYSLMQAGAVGDGVVGSAVISQVLAAEDLSFLPVLIDLLRVPLSQRTVLFNSDLVIPALQQLSGQFIGYDLKEWGEWLGRQPEVTTPPGYVRWKGVLLSRIDRRFADYFIDSETNLAFSEDQVKLDVTQINWGSVLKDDGSGQSIPSLVNPTMIAPDAATYLVEEDRVFGVSINGDHRAYPLRIMNWHEMANDVVGGQPVALAYCTLCGAGILFDTTVDESIYTFRTSGLLYKSNKLMYDLGTDTLWNQFIGEPVLGKLADSGIKLEILPITLTTWGEWLSQHPDTVVLDIETGYSRNYASEGQPGAGYNDYFAYPDTWFAVPERDERLEAKALVYGLELNGETRAYPIEALQKMTVVNDSLGGVDVVLVTDSGTSGVRVYQRDGMTFSRAAEDPDDNAILDEEGGIWRISEEALVSLADPEVRLDRIGGHVSFWFGWYAFHPETTIYSEEFEP